MPHSIKSCMDKAQSFNKCEAVTIIIGSNDVCCRNAKAICDIMQEYESLLVTLKKQFPNALIRICSILPRKGKLGELYNNNIMSFNSGLKSMCDVNSVPFLEICKHFVYSNGSVKAYLYGDMTHLNGKGASVLARVLKLAYSDKSKSTSVVDVKQDKSVESVSLNDNHSQNDINRHQVQVNNSQTYVPMPVDACGIQNLPVSHITQPVYNTPVTGYLPQFYPPSMNTYPGAQSPWPYGQLQATHIPTPHTFNQWQVPYSHHYNMQVPALPYGGGLFPAQAVY